MQSIQLTRFSTLQRTDTETTDATPTESNNDVSDRPTSVILRKARRSSQSTRRVATILLAGPLSTLTSKSFSPSNMASVPMTSRVALNPELSNKTLEESKRTTRNAGYTAQRWGLDVSSLGDYDTNRSGHPIDLASNSQDMARKGFVQKGPPKTNALPEVMRDWTDGLLSIQPLADLAPEFAMLDSRLESQMESVSSDPNNNQVDQDDQAQTNTEPRSDAHWMDQALPSTSSWINPLTRTTSPNAVPLSTVLKCIKDNSNQLQHLKRDTVWIMLKLLQKYGMTQELAVADWHRVFSRIVDMAAPFNTIPDSLECSRAIFLLQEMKKCGVQPDAFVYGCMYRAMRDRTKMVLMVHEQAIQDLEKYPRFRKVAKAADVPADYPISNKSIRTLLAVFLRRKTSPKYHMGVIYRLWDQVIQTPILLTIDTYLGFLEAFALSDDKVMVERFHMFLATRGGHSGSLGLKAYEGIMAAHNRLKNYRAVRRQMEILAEKSINPRLATYRLAFQAYEQLQDYGSIYAADAQMKKLGIDHDSVTYAALLRAAQTHEKGLSKVKDLHKRINAQIKISIQRERSLSQSKTELNQEDARALLSHTVYESLLEAYAAVGTWTDVKRVFDQMHAVRVMSIAIKNKRNGLPETTAGFISLANPNKIWSLPFKRRTPSTSANALISAQTPTDMPSIPVETVSQADNPTEIDLSESQAQYDRIKNSVARTFLPPEPSRRSLCAIVAVLGKTFDIDRLRDFFLKHIFTADRLGLYWMRQLLAQSDKIRQFSTATQTKIDQMREVVKNRSHSRGSRERTESSLNAKRRRRREITSQNREMHELKGSMAQASRKFKRGIPVQVGFNGPLAAVYTVMDHAWRGAIFARVEMEQSNSRASGDPLPSADMEGELLMQLEGFLKELEKREEELVLSLGFRGISRSATDPTATPLPTGQNTVEDKYNDEEDVINVNSGNSYVGNGADLEGPTLPLRIKPNEKKVRSRRIVTDGRMRSPSIKSRRPSNRIKALAPISKVHRQSFWDDQ
ncbi:hypothetical protein BSLG_007865 [Batrachochytrium salamandrivorans]|nr:hypothetical protein BASA83_001028 [Batrachochytrium salamandrivorans]KAJ1334710.1 hypothetical protein BSLG_007865 [Batrachochytrium salamandrivorans]